MSDRERLVANPFYVLELPTHCSRQEIERAGQKLLAMLDVGLEAARVYPTPLGGMPRDADLVRRSLDELRDPDRRLLHEVWATLDPGLEASLDDAEPPDAWRGLLTDLGWTST
jgi:hypothetical protein